MKTNEKKLLLVVLLIPLLLLFLYSFNNFKNLRVPYTSVFEDQLIHTIQSSTNFYMTRNTHFKWDKMYVFGPYTSKKQMQEKIGLKWTTSNYISYLFCKYIVDIDGLDDDSFQKLVFVKDQKVVYDSTLYRGDGDFTHIKGIITPGNDLLYVVKSEKDFPIITNYKPTLQDKDF